MDASKILLVICAFALIVCLTLCITTLSVLRNAVAENGTLQSDANALVGELTSCVEQLNEYIDTSDSIEVSVGTDTKGTTDGGFCMRDTNGTVGIYTSDGYLVKLLDVSVSTLPPAAREALAKGITVGSWEELISLIQDYTA